VENIDIFYGIWNILWPFGIFYDYLVHVVFVWYICSGLGIMSQDKSGNPAGGESLAARKKDNF
jgi:hypothetical protein